MSELLGPDGCFAWAALPWLDLAWLGSQTWSPLVSSHFYLLTFFSWACCSHVSIVLYVKCTEHGAGSVVDGMETEMEMMVWDGGQSLPATHLKFSQNCFLSLALFGFGFGFGFFVCSRSFAWITLAGFRGRCSSFAIAITVPIPSRLVSSVPSVLLLLLSLLAIRAELACQRLIDETMNKLWILCSWGSEIEDVEKKPADCDANDGLESCNYKIK